MLLIDLGHLYWWLAAMHNLQRTGRAASPDYLEAHAGWMRARERLERRGFRV